MSHKIAKALRAADRGVATPHNMHTLLIDQRRRTPQAVKTKKRPHNRHKKTRIKVRIAKATELLRYGSMQLRKHEKLYQWTGLSSTGRLTLTDWTPLKQYFKKLIEHV